MRESWLLHNHRKTGLEYCTLVRPSLIWVSNSCHLPYADRTVYENVLPRTISHWAEISRPIPATKQRSPTNMVCVKTPRKFIMASERDKNVVANPPIAKGAYGTKIAGQYEAWISQEWLNCHTGLARWDPGFMVVSTGLETSVSFSFTLDMVSGDIDMIGS